MVMKSSRSTEDPLNALASISHRDDRTQGLAWVINRKIGKDEGYKKVIGTPLLLGIQ